MAVAIPKLSTPVRVRHGQVPAGRGRIDLEGDRLRLSVGDRTVIDAAATALQLRRDPLFSHEALRVRGRWYRVKFDDKTTRDAWREAITKVERLRATTLAQLRAERAQGAAAARAIADPVKGGELRFDGRLLTHGGRAVGEVAQVKAPVLRSGRIVVTTRDGAKHSFWLAPERGPDKAWEEGGGAVAEAGDTDAGAGDVGDGLLLPLLVAYVVLDKNLIRRDRRRDWVRALSGDLDAVLIERKGRAEDRLAREERMNSWKPPA